MTLCTEHFWQLSATGFVATVVIRQGRLRLEMRSGDVMTSIGSSSLSSELEAASKRNATSIRVEMKTEETE